MTIDPRKLMERMSENKTFPRQYIGKLSDDAATQMVFSIVNCFKPQTMTPTETTSYFMQLTALFEKIRDDKDLKTFVPMNKMMEFLQRDVCCYLETNETMRKTVETIINVKIDDCKCSDEDK